MAVSWKTVLPQFDGKILRSPEDGYNLFVKNDGTDYTRIWRDLRAGRIENLKILGCVSHRKVYLAEIDGRSFLLKVDSKTPSHLDMKLWRILHGPVHSAHMKAVNRAVRQGCRVTQDIYFVAEKKGLISPETYIILEYLPGVTLSGKDLNKYRDAVGTALAELHRYGLSSSDIHPGNFLVTDEGVKVIDLSTKGSAWAGKGRDIIDAKEKLGVEVPIQGPLEWLAVSYVRLKRFLKKASNSLRSFFKTKK